MLITLVCIIFHYLCIRETYVNKMYKMEFEDPIKQKMVSVYLSVVYAYTYMCLHCDVYWCILHVA